MLLVVFGNTMYVSIFSNGHLTVRWPEKVLLFMLETTFNVSLNGALSVNKQLTM